MCVMLCVCYIRRVCMFIVGGRFKSDRVSCILCVPLCGKLSISAVVILAPVRYNSAFMARLLIVTLRLTMNG